MGLRVFDEEGEFAVVLSDMRMPGIDGAAMLSAIKERNADVVTMLLTGHADFESAMSAVNDGNVFRMLSKPCPPERLIQSLYAGLRQHELIVGEKVLLEQTLKGAVDALSPSLGNRQAFVFLVGLNACNALLANWRRGLKSRTSGGSRWPPFFLRLLPLPCLKQFPRMYITRENYRRKFRR